eukprot:7722128-Pyramimonas_sp.AAC.1
MGIRVPLCRPDPEGRVPFDPARGKLVDLCGSEVGRPAPLNLFRAACDSGGRGSPRLETRSRMRSRA